jgi:competence protein ComGC
MRQKHAQSGLGAIGMLVSVLILGMLIYAYVKNQVGSGQGGSAGAPMTSIDKSRAAACLAQRRTIERDVVAWSVEHDHETASVAALEAAGFPVPPCPEGGEYSISGQHVYCSLHR